MMIKGLPKYNAAARGLKVAGITLALAGMTAIAAHAAPVISGSVEASANRNWATPDENTTNVFHSYDAQANTFNLNNAHLAIAGADSTTGLGYTVETDFGSDGALDASLAGSGPLTAAGYAIDLQEAYITWAFGAGRMWGIKAGKYATYQGIEVVEGGANPTITRGFLFGLAEPVTHTGAEINMANGPVDVHVGVINGWDQAADQNAVPSYLAKIGYNMGAPLAVAVSAIVGPEKAGNTDDLRMSFDLTAVTKAIPMTDLWLQANYGMEEKAGVGGDDASWLGLGVQPLVHFNDWFGLGLRYEYFMDDKLSRVGAAGSVGTNTDITLQNITVAPTIWLTKTAMIRAEFRVDMASEDVFADADKKATGTQLGSAVDMVLGF